MIHGDSRIFSDGLPDQGPGIVEIAVLKCNQAGKMQGVGMGRLLIQNLIIKDTGFRQTALLVQGNCRCQTLARYVLFIRHVSRLMQRTRA